MMRLDSLSTVHQFVCCPLSHYVDMSGSVKPLLYWDQLPFVANSPELIKAHKSSHYCFDNHFGPVLYAMFVQDVVCVFSESRSLNRHKLKRSQLLDDKVHHPL